MCIRDSHKASLVHDDIQDDDQYRYGRETLHRQHGAGHAINIGDYLIGPVSYTHLRAHETVLDLVCRLLLEKKKKDKNKQQLRIETVRDILERRIIKVIKQI